MWRGDYWVNSFSCVLCETNLLLEEAGKTIHWLIKGIKRERIERLRFYVNESITEIQSAKCLYRIHRIRQPLFSSMNTTPKGSTRLDDGIDSTIWAQASVASILFFIHTHLLPPPQESYERQLERRWDLKVVLLRTQLRLNAPRHFSWSHFVGHWLSPVLAHYPLLLTVLCKFCLPPTDDGETERERIVEYAEVEIGIELIATLKFRRILPVSLRLMGIIVFRFNEWLKDDFICSECKAKYTLTYHRFAFDEVEWRIIFLRIMDLVWWCFSFISGRFISLLNENNKRRKQKNSVENILRRLSDNF